MQKRWGEKEQAALELIGDFTRHVLLEYMNEQWPTDSETGIDGKTLLSQALSEYTNGQFSSVTTADITAQQNRNVFPSNEPFVRGGSFHLEAVIPDNKTAGYRNVAADFVGLLINLEHNVIKGAVGGKKVIVGTDFFEQVATALIEAHKALQGLGAGEIELPNYVTPEELRHGLSWFKSGKLATKET